ncbi:uncharacterized protein BX664DRAFT_319960 [Halteromyces radiatus]|uniref:uncharacterized protein n=1 Tax=Halteromyces radiatus TaxID=101107 RepID=UPI00221F7B99|nr:uncharacterized protein BX664DRAFT_319960 [Halteromyces radiatus]KAI8098935.1 hypothetical protein BX664DRAFT_319960 [Halteromyces radiatus]
MDISVLFRKRRPSRLTMGQTSSERLLLPQPTETNNRREIRSEVTGPPTKDHWKIDNDVTSCAYPNCSRIFGFFQRRHHCRKCGDIFCAIHCSNYLRLNQDSEFHPQGFLSRGCDECADKWRHPSLTLTSTSTDSSDGRSVEEQGKGGKSNRNRHAGIMTLQPHAMEGVLELGRDDIVQVDTEDKDKNGMNIGSKKMDGVFNTVAMSVPADWHWSTF